MLSKQVDSTAANLSYVKKKSDRLKKKVFIRWRGFLQGKNSQSLSITQPPYRPPFETNNFYNF